jgi:integrase
MATRNSRGRRLRGTGGIVHHKSGPKAGRWTAVIDLGPANGKVRDRRSFTADTHKEAEAWLLEKRYNLGRGVKPPPGKGATLKEWLDVWYSTKEIDSRPATVQRYARTIEDNLVPNLGSIRLPDLKAEHIDAMTRKLLKTYEPSTVNYILTVLHGALELAVNRDLIPKNPVKAATHPKVENGEVDAYEPDEARKILEAAEADPYHAWFVVALSTALRPSEIQGLRKSLLDLDNGELRVAERIEYGSRKRWAFAAPKTNSSRRTVNLGPGVVDVLRSHLAAQAERELASPRWKDNDLVFAGTNGAPVPLRTINDHWHKVVRRAGVRKLSSYNQRHTAASTLLAMGVPIEVVSKYLGHAQLSTTMERYSHFKKSLFQDAAAKMDTALFR